MNQCKQPVSLSEQVKKLQSRGLIVEDFQECENFLAKFNYYRFSAYLLPFKTDNDTYIKGTTFSHIVNICEFDMQMRHILLEITENIEIDFRAKVSYFHSMKYGSLGYLNPNNFSPLHNASEFISAFQRQVGNNKKLPFVAHHIEKYNSQFPLWVAVELFSFGMLSKFIADLKSDDRKQISKQYNMTEKELKSRIFCCSVLRNFCAHYSRLYFYKFTSIPRGISCDCKNRLFAQILSLKSLYNNPQKWDDFFAPKIKQCITQYQADLSHIGFPVSDDYLGR